MAAVEFVLLMWMTPLTWVSGLKGFIVGRKWKKELFVLSGGLLFAHLEAGKRVGLWSSSRCVYWEVPVVSVDGGSLGKSAGHLGYYSAAHSSLPLFISLGVQR
jgi:hypothetical protein